MKIQVIFTRLERLLMGLENLKDIFTGDPSKFLTERQKTLLGDEA